MTVYYKKWLNFPFDQFSRQIQVYETLNILKTNEKETFKLIDIGGYGGITSSLHAKDDVTVLDVFDIKERGYIQGNGTDTHFQDDEFDFAVSFDVLEHIEKKDRHKFIKESARIAKRGLIAAFPVKNEANEYAEQSLNMYYAKLHGKTHRWLQEHIDFSIPSQNHIEEIFAKLGMKTFVMNSNDVELWLLMQEAIFLTSKHIDIGGASMAKLNRYYNEKIGAFDTVDNGKGSYRKIIIGLKNEEDYKMIRQWFDTKKTSIAVVDRLKVIEKINVFHSTLLELAKKEKRKVDGELRKAERSIKHEQQNSRQLLKDIEDIRNSKTYRFAHALQSAIHRVKKVAKG